MNIYRKEYLLFKESQQNIMDDFLNHNAFFAFSEDQFSSGLKKLNANVEDIVNVESGGYVLKSKFDEFNFLIKYLKTSLQEFLKDEDHFLAAMLYEFENFGLNSNGLVYVLREAFGLSVADLSKSQRYLLNEAIDIFNYS